MDLGTHRLCRRLSLGVLEAPSPSIFTVLSSFTEFNFSDLLARRVAPKHKDLKDALPVLSLLMRGLHTRNSQFVPKSTCVRTIVGRAAPCTGMHECARVRLIVVDRQRVRAVRVASSYKEKVVVGGREL